MREEEINMGEWREQGYDTVEPNEEKRKERRKRQGQYFNQYGALPWLL